MVLIIGGAFQGKTKYVKEKYGVNPHCTWVPAAEDREIVQWIFSQRKMEEL